MTAPVVHPAGAVAAPRAPVVGRRAELDDRMRLNNWSIAASYDTARIFAGFGSSTAQVDHLAPAPHRLVLRQHAGVGLCSGSIRHFKRRVMGGMWGVPTPFCFSAATL